MFMADLCYIFLNIIKWFLKSSVCFRSHTKYEIEVLISSSIFKYT